MKHNKKTVDRFSRIPEGKSIKDVIDELPEELKISSFFSRGNTQRLDRNKCVPTLVPGHSNFPIHPWEHRSITVREAGLITGFPNDFKFHGYHGSRCTQIGNAVPVHLSDAIAKSVIKILQ
jgi:DNA (cytosine-5)-methyltransferase 1